MTTRNSAADDTVISVMEETAEIGVRARVTGRTRVTTRTETVVEDVEASIESRSIEVRRVPVGRDLERGEPVPVSREEGDTTIVPVFEEFLVVEKRLRLVEEVHIRRITEVEDVHVPVTLRRQVADIEHDDVAADETQDETQPANP